MLKRPRKVRKTKGASKSAKCFLFILLSSLWLPINYLGDAIKPTSASDRSTYQDHPAARNTLSSDEAANNQDAGMLSTSIAKPFLWIWCSINTIASTGLSLLVLSFLNDQGTSKECLLLYGILYNISLLLQLFLNFILKFTKIGLQHMVRRCWLRRLAAINILLYILLCFLNFNLGTLKIVLEIYMFKIDTLGRCGEI